MDAVHLVLLFVAVGVIAFLYSTVGHAGASGYIAAMTLWGIAPSVIRPTALLLNIPVAAIGAFQFWLASREPPFSGAHNFVIPGGRPDNCWNKTHFYQVGMPRRPESFRARRRVRVERQRRLSHPSLRHRPREFDSRGQALKAQFIRLAGSQSHT